MDWRSKMWVEKVGKSLLDVSEQWGVKWADVLWWCEVNPFDGAARYAYIEVTMEVTVVTLGTLLQLHIALHQPFLHRGAGGRRCYSWNQYMEHLPHWVMKTPKENSRKERVRPFLKLVLWEEGTADKLPVILYRYSTTCPPLTLQGSRYYDFLCWRMALGEGDRCVT